MKKIFPRLQSEPKVNTIALQNLSFRNQQTENGQIGQSMNSENCSCRSVSGEKLIKWDIINFSLDKLCQLNIVVTCNNVLAIVSYNLLMLVVTCFYFSGIPGINKKSPEVSLRALLVEHHSLTGEQKSSRKPIGAILGTSIKPVHLLPRMDAARLTYLTVSFSRLFPSQIYLSPFLLKIGPLGDIGQFPIGLEIASIGNCELCHLTLYKIGGLDV